MNEKNEKKFHRRIEKMRNIKAKNTRKMKDIKQKKNNKEDVTMAINKNRGDKIYEKEVRYECNKKNKRDN